MKEAIKEYQFVSFYSVPLIRELKEDRDKTLIQLCDDIKSECTAKQQ